MDFRGKRLPDGSYISALTAEYPSAFASAIIDVISPWVSQSSLMNQDLSRTQNHWRCRRHQLRKLDHTSIRWLLQFTSTSLDQTHSSDQTTHQGSRCLQTSSIRPLPLWGRNTSLPQGHPEHFSFHSTGPHHSRPSTFSPQAPSLFASHLKRSRSNYCYLTSRRYSLRGLLTTSTCWTVGTQQQHLVRIPWPCCMSWQLDQCKPRLRRHTQAYPKGTRWWFHWRAAEHRNSWKEMA